MGDPLCVNVSPLMFESQYTESSNVGTQSEDPNNCRQIFATESVTQNYFVLVYPKNADESNKNADESNENADESTENADESNENADESNENADESNENADESTDTVVFETSDFNTIIDLVSSTESEPSDNTQNTQTLSQYVRGPDTQENSQEMYPDTLSQSSEPLIRSDRRPEQRYEFASEDCSNSLDPTYEPPAFEIPQLTRQDAIIPFTSSKRYLESTKEDNEDNKPP